MLMFGSAGAQLDVKKPANTGIFFVNLAKRNRTLEHVIRKMGIREAYLWV